MLPRQRLLPVTHLRRRETITSISEILWLEEGTLSITLNFFLLFKEGYGLNVELKLRFDEVVLASGES